MAMLAPPSSPPVPSEGLGLRGDRGHGARGTHRTTETDDSRVDNEGRRILCRHCGATIASHTGLFAMGGQSPQRVFANPYGLLRKIVTLRTATGLVFQGPPITDFSWFPGYSWEVAYCARCRAHLGWRFTTTEPEATPGLFFGLLVSEIEGL